MKVKIPIDLKPAVLARVELALARADVSLPEAVEQMLVMVAMLDGVVGMHPFYAKALKELRGAPGDGSETFARLLAEDDARRSLEAFEEAFWHPEESEGMEQQLLLSSSMTPAGGDRARSIR